MIDADQIRRAADEVLERPGYRDLVDGPLARLVTEVRSWFAERLFDLFGDANAARFGQIVAIAVVLLVAGLAVVALASLRRQRAADLTVPVDSHRTADQERDAADRAAAAGDWTEAVRRRYAALVLRLEEHEVLALRPGTTVGEVDGAVSRNLPSAGVAVAAAGRTLADVVYGHAAAGAVDDATVAAALDRVGLRVTPVSPSAGVAP